MKILSWNINGLISFIESQSYLEIEKIDADVICFQETRTRRKLAAMSGYFHYYFPCEKDGLHGTLTLTKKEPLNIIYGLGEKIFDAEGRVLWQFRELARAKLTLNVTIICRRKFLIFIFSGIAIKLNLFAEVG